MARIGDIRREVRRAYRRLRNWRAVAAELGMTSGMAYRIGMDGYEPKEAKIRARLGLPAFGKAPVCAHCGEVHVSKKCAKRGRKKAVRLCDLPVKELRRRLEEREEIE